jgi:hypothetical protein
MFAALRGLGLEWGDGTGGREEGPSVRTEAPLIVVEENRFRRNYNLFEDTTSITRGAM